MATDASNWVVTTSASSPSLEEGSSHVMAWARDSATGEPVYVLELDETRRGAKCGCECPSCELPLQAVNAAKKEYKKRPHFRHPEGAPKSECLYLSARLAAIQLLRDQGVIQLPRRTVQGQVVGLSGVIHEAWVHRPAQTLAIRDFNFRDRAAAILTLEDGRTLRVLLVGNGPNADHPVRDGDQIPTVRLELPDLSLASMSLEELRSRLTLLPESLCWLSHWDDANLLAQAEAKAVEVAENLMDLEGEHSDALSGIEPKFRRETLLHLEVKRILAESREIRVPSLRVRVDAFAENGFGFEREWSRPAETLALLNVQLEKKLGRLIPDVIAQVLEDRGSFMMIEVTVTNRIDEERMSRIRVQNIPTLEIDLSISGGLVSRAILKEMVIYGLDIKKWLHHPEQIRQSAKLTVEVENEVLEIEAGMLAAEARRQNVLATAINEIASDYLDLIFKCAEIDLEDTDSAQQKLKKKICLKRIDEVAGDLAIHGYAGAGASELFYGRQGIIPRILSIKIGRGVGYKLDSTMAVMNAIRQSKGENRSNHSIYLIAEKVYRSDFEPVASWYQDWATEVRNSIKSQEKIYIRDGKYDKLLSMLFPEMAKGLKTGFGLSGHTRTTGRLNAPKPVAKKMASLTNRLLDTDSKDVWLKGRDLEDWKRRNPISAQAYKDPPKLRK